MAVSIGQPNKRRKMPMSVAKLLPFSQLPTGDVYGPFPVRPSLDGRGLVEVVAESSRPELQRLLAELWQTERYESFQTVVDALTEWSDRIIDGMVDTLGPETEVVAMPCPKCERAWSAVHGKSHGRIGPHIVRHAGDADPPTVQTPGQCGSVPNGCESCGGTGFVERERIIREYRYPVNRGDWLDVERTWKPYKRPPSGHKCSTDCKTLGCGRYVTSNGGMVAPGTIKQSPEEHYRRALQSSATAWRNGLVAQATFGITHAMGRKSVPVAIETKQAIRSRLQSSLGGRRRLRSRRTKADKLRSARQHNDALAKSRGIVGTIAGVPVLVGNGTIRRLPLSDAIGRTSGRSRRSESAEVEL